MLVYVKPRCKAHEACIQKAQIAECDFNMDN